jgi:hypothetical protein
MMQLSRWKFVGLWQLSGMLCALGVGAIFAFVANLRHGVDALDSAFSVPNDLAYVIAGVVLIAPLSMLVLWAWMVATARYPRLEGSLVRAIINLTGCALGLAVLAGVISNWEMLRIDTQRDTFLADVVSVTKSVLLWAIVGVVLPRLVVPRLRPNPSAPRITA